MPLRCRFPLQGANFVLEAERPSPGSLNGNPSLLGHGSRRSARLGPLGQPGLVIALDSVVLRISDTEDRAIGGHDLCQVEDSSAVGIPRASQRIRAFAAMLGVLRNDSADR